MVLFLSPTPAAAKGWAIVAPSVSLAANVSAMGSGAGLFGHKYLLRYCFRVCCNFPRPRSPTAPPSLLVTTEAFLTKTRHRAY